MEDFYLNLQTGKEERLLVEYITCLVNELSLHKRLKTRYQKIVVDVAKKLNLPITRFWYLYGEITLFDFNSTIGNLDKSYVRTLITGEFGYTDEQLKEIETSVKESALEFTEDFSSDCIREKQYTKYKNEKFLCILEIENIIKIYGYEERKEEILLLISKLLSLLPEEGSYRIELYKKTFDFLLILKKSKFSGSKIGTDLFRKSFSDIKQYICTVEGINTVVGPLESEARRELIKNVEDDKYHVIGSINNLKENYKIICLPQIELHSESEMEVFRSILELEQVY